MQFSCEREPLLNAAVMAARTAPVKAPFPSLAGALVVCGHGSVQITGYDLTTGVTTRLDADILEEGRLVLPAKVLADAVRKLPEDVVTVKTSKGKVTITCAETVYDLEGTSAEDYPSLPDEEGRCSLVMTQETLRDMITRTVYAVSGSESRPILTGALFEALEGQLTMVAVDGYRLALRREAVEMHGAKSISFVVPGAALREVERLCNACDRPVEISLGDSLVTFKLDDTTLVSRRLAGEFMDYRSVIPKDNPVKVVMDAVELRNSIERVSVLINENVRSVIRCRLESGIFSMSIRTGLGFAKDKCPMVGDGSGMEIGFNNRFLLDAVKNAPAENLLLELSDPSKPCVIRPNDEDGYLAMVLPVRLGSVIG